jgi:gliding motility-associated lipoprotein GldD
MRLLQYQRPERHNAALKYWIGLAIMVLLLACNSNFVPRPKAYFKIDLPEKQYRVFDTAGYPYSFEYPAYAQVVKDTTFFDSTPENPWWINIDFPQFGARMYISYKKVGPNDLGKLINDAYNLTYKHSYKASSIEDSAMQTTNGVRGVFFRVGGDAATANQFFLTDSITHFLRGALYFDTTPNEDSLQPVNDFLLQDMRHLINSFRWK